MVYRKLEEKYINAFVDYRIEFITSIRDVENLEEFRQNTLQYIKDNINNDNLIIYVAIENEEIVSSCMLCAYEMIPLPSNPYRKTGILLNVYTREKFRNQGHAKKLINLIIEEAKSKGISKILLEYTNEGYPLYKSLGFKELENQMEYRI